MYDEAADFAEHRTQMESMDTTLAACGVFVDWPTATVCDVGGGGGLRAGLLASRAKRVHCADVIDQQARYGGEFVKLLAEKLERHGHHLPVDRFAVDVTDATRLMYRDGWFDFICSVNAFEHIPDPNLALTEIARVLRPGGHAYISFDPIWTADTGNHFQHYVPEPWAHLVLDEAQFVARMRGAGAEDWEVNDFHLWLNRHRLGVYQRLFGVSAKELGLNVLAQQSWSGVVDDANLLHENWELALKTYSREELLTRGMYVLMRKNTQNHTNLSSSYQSGWAIALRKKFWRRQVSQ